MEWQITNATLATAADVTGTARIKIADGRVSEVGTDAGDEDVLSINLHGLPVYPGFINGHDSLLGSYHAYQGKQHPYSNWLAWDNEVKASPLFKERLMLPTEDLYRLGSYRNLINGATFVVDHIPHFVRRPFQDSMPVRLLEDYGIAHSACSYSLEWGDGIRREYERAAKDNLPFVIHIAEGFDQESRRSLRYLDDAGGLGEHTVLVHGLALSESDLDRIAEAGAHLIWCPRSNLHVYQATLPVGLALDRGINVCLGSDASMYGSDGLLEDLHAARDQLAEEAGHAVDPSLLLAMLTANPAKAFRLNGQAGTLNEGDPASFIVAKGKYPDDALGSLAELELEEIYLVVRDGLPLYADEGLERVFTEAGVIFDRVQLHGQNRIVHKGYRELLERVGEATGAMQEFAFLPLATGVS